MDDELDLGPVWDRLDDDYRESLIGSADFVCTLAGKLDVEGGEGRGDAIAHALRIRREKMLPTVGARLTPHGEEWHESIIRRLAEAMLDGRFPRPTEQDRRRRARGAIVVMIAEGARSLMGDGVPRDDALARGAAPLAEIAADAGHDLDVLTAEAAAMLDAD